MNKEVVWHCIFCGRHWSGGPPTLTKKGFTIQCCPSCREYKGLEICNPETCDCWELDFVRKLAEEEGLPNYKDGGG